MALDINTLIGRTVYDQDGSKLGSIGQIYVDERTDDPTFATVNMGLFGTKETFIPLDRVTEGEKDLTVPYTKDFIKDAPSVEPDGHLDENEQDQLLRHYQANGPAAGSGGRTDGPAAGGTGAGGRQDGKDRAGTDPNTKDDATRRNAAQEDLARRNADDPDGAAEGRPGDLSGRPGDQSGRPGDQAGRPGDATGRPGDQSGRPGDLPGGRDTGRTQDEGMTRREEELHVGTERVETGRVRLRKHVTTEQRTVTVPVQHEEVEVVREPVEGGHSGGKLSDDVQEVTLSEDRPVVEKEVVEKERVRLDRQSRTDEQQVSADVSREEIEVEQDGGRTPGADRPGADRPGHDRPTPGDKRV